MSSRERGLWGDRVRAPRSSRQKRRESEDVVLSRQWGVDVCSRCGSTILMGEKVLRLHVRGRHEALCPLCQARARRVDRAA
jgi:hypothetical protein